MTATKFNPEIQLTNASDIEAVLKDLENEYKKPTAVKPSRRAMNELAAGGRAYKKHDWAGAVKHLLVAWDELPSDLNLLTLLSHSLVQLGVREQAISVLEKAMKHHAPSAEIVSIMLQLANEMQMFDIAIKIGNILLSLDQDHANHFVNVASAYKSAERYDEAIDLCKVALSKFPEHAGLWNILAVSVNLRDGEGSGNVFFEEALRLDPENVNFLSNMAQSLVNQNQNERAMEFDRAAIKAAPDAPEPHLGLAMICFCQGEMKEAWEHYDYRLDTRRSYLQVQTYTHKLPDWAGRDLTGKTLLIASEQGIGDEVMFGNFLPYLYERAEKLVIGCATRLVPIYKRRFPDAFVCTAVDKIQSGYRYRSFPEAEFAMRDGELHVDYAAQLASAARYDWLTPEDIKPHPDGFLTPDPERDAEFKERLASVSSKPRIGIAWRSGNVSGVRRRYYPEVANFKPLMDLADHVDFVNLQYAGAEEDIKLIKDKYGVDIINFEDVDLKNDIEANLAIMNNCDLVLSVASAPAQFAIAIGVSTVVMGTHDHWWRFGNKESKVSFAKDAEIVLSDEAYDWSQAVERSAKRIAERLNLPS